MEEQVVYNPPGQAHLQLGPNVINISCLLPPWTLDELPDFDLRTHHT